MDPPRLTRRGRCHGMPPKGRPAPRGLLHFALGAGAESRGLRAEGSGSLAWRVPVGGLWAGRRSRLAGPRTAPIGACVQRPRSLVEASVLSDLDAPRYNLKAPSADMVARGSGLRHGPRGRGAQRGPRHASCDNPNTSPRCHLVLGRRDHGRPHRGSGLPAELCCMPGGRHSCVSRVAATGLPAAGLVGRSRAGAACVWGPPPSYSSPGPDLVGVSRARGCHVTLYLFNDVRRAFDPAVAPPGRPFSSTVGRHLTLKPVAQAAHVGSRWPCRLTGRRDREAGAHRSPSQRGPPSVPS